MKKLLALAVLMLSAFAGRAALQVGPAQPPASSDPLGALRWRSIGPANTGGRVTAVEGIAGDPTTFYVGAADGGIWKTVNAGTTFRPVFDHQSTLSIGALAVAPSDANVVYAGTGEGNPRNSVSFGDGLYRSTDAGESWTHLGLADTERIARIRVDPRNPDVAYVAALGHEWGANEERGLFKTADGGKTWQKILYLDADTGCSDVELDPSNPRIVYAGMWTFRRKPWRFDSGGGKTGLYKSTDGGATWKHLTQGLPDKPMDRIGLAVARSQPETVYMVTEFPDNGGVLFRSDDRGESWRVLQRDPSIGLRPFYFGVVRVDPKDADRVYVLGGNLNRSSDGGRTIEQFAANVHSDHHAFWIDPVNPKRIVEGNDGGVYQSWDGGKTFDYLNTLALSQFYHVAYDLQEPYHVCGGLQDNFNWCGPSMTTLNEGIRRDDWKTLMFGDGFFVVPDPSRPNLVYNDTQGGIIGVTDLSNGATRAIAPTMEGNGSSGDGLAKYKYRFNWNAPIAISPHDPKTVYFGGNVLFKTADAGQTWQPISADLTTNDKSKQQSSGGDVVTDNTAAEFHCTILTIAESPVKAGVIWVGTDDGNVQVTKDGGKTWTNVVKNIQGLPANSWIPAVEASHADAGTAYVAADRHQSDDFGPYAFKTTDYGQTWTAIKGDLPARGYVHVVREDPKNRSLLYAGTELGIFASWDAGAHWTSIRGALPPVAVRDILVHPRDNDLIIGTHGRGAWILDDITPLQQLTEAQAAGVFLFDLQPAIRWQTSSANVFTGDRTFAGPNPPSGAAIDYYLRAEPAGDAGVSVHIVDRAGKAVRAIANPPKRAGINRLVWDLRYDAPDAPQPPAGGRRGEGPGGRGGRGGGRFGAPGGPPVGPGDYTVVVAAGGREMRKTVKVAIDPRMSVSAADVAAQTTALLTLRDMTSRMNELVDRSDRLIAQLTTLADDLGGPDGDKEVLQFVNRALEHAKTLREPMTRKVPSLGYRYPGGLRDEVNALSGAIGGYIAAPTAVQADRLKQLQPEVDKAVSEMREMLAKTVPDLNSRLSNRPKISVAPIK
ncbi:MAG TPA: hypothetical protein VL309_05605 [Vicinamibacterales bacterium]|jgi:photosystem II stability/assembly factor-like uncharacterized protein|nr:hypothetical protein [Vicinamibacterales bacterium]